MKQDNTNIFIRRVSSRQVLQPTSEELRAFLEQRKKKGFLVALVNGMSNIRELLIESDTFEQRRKLEPGLQDLRERMVFGVLRHSRFINEELLTAVAQFEYLLDMLVECDFDSPTEFIASAEKTIKKLKRGKIDDMVRLERLTEMIEERRSILTVLAAQWAVLTGELLHIVDHVRENFLQIETLCRKSIVVLVEIGLEKKKENELIEDIRKQFLRDLKNTNGVRQLTDRDLKKAGDICNRLAKKLSEMIRDDLYSLAGLYEVVHDRAKDTVAELDGLLGELVRLKTDERQAALRLYQKISHVLVSLVVEFPAGLRPGKVDLGGTRNADLMKKRRDMVNYLLDQAGLERRERSERRARQERRKTKDPNFRGTERRASAERRTRAGRRTRQKQS